MVKKQIVVLTALIVAIFLTGCTHYREQLTTSPKQQVQLTFKSNLVGTWYCSRQNSCNDMEITLTITQEGETLYLTRDMVSESGFGDSCLQGTAVAYDSDYAFADFTVGNYKFTEDGYLLEYFARNDRWNLYTRDGFTQEKLEGRYND